MLAEKDVCTGCMACRNACPMDCIYVTNDELGFQYPHIDEKKCLQCGLCEKCCPEQGKSMKKNEKLLQVYAGWMLRDEGKKKIVFRKK